MMQHKSQQQFSMSMFVACLLGLVCLASLAQVASAGQGCPFDDSSCQEYCNQQGCNMGYCGHFAWTQCICRKCGDEWNTHDKVKSKPNAAINQTELDSLKMTNPLVLTGSGSGNNNSSPAATHQEATGARSAQPQPPATTLSSLILPDLSESKLNGELNDMPEENSEKFLDYIAKNHERIVEQQSATNKPTSADEQEPATTQSPKPTVVSSNSDEPDESAESSRTLSRLLLSRAGQDVPTIYLS